MEILFNFRENIVAAKRFEQSFEIFIVAVSKLYYLLMRGT